jgi:hypothetical protein
MAERGVPGWLAVIGPHEQRVRQAERGTVMAAMATGGPLRQSGGPMRQSGGPMRQTGGPSGQRVATVHSKLPAQVGGVSFSGRVFNLVGEHIGTVEQDGRVCMPQGFVVGWASPTGEIADHRGIVLTRVLPNGSVVDRQGYYVGRVSLVLEVSLQQAAGAALLLLPVEGAA